MGKAQVLGKREKGFFPESLELVFPEPGLRIQPSAVLKRMPVWPLSLLGDTTQTGSSIKGDFWAHGTENAKAWLPSRYRPGPDNRVRPQVLCHLLPALSVAAHSQASHARRQVLLPNPCSRTTAYTGQPHQKGLPHWVSVSSSEVLGRTLTGPAGVPACL